MPWVRPFTYVVGSYKGNLAETESLEVPASTRVSGSQRETGRIHTTLRTTHRRAQLEPVNAVLDHLPRRAQAARLR